MRIGRDASNAEKKERERKEVKKKKDKESRESRESGKSWKIASLAAAEVAFFLAWSSYSTTPLASILNPVLLLPAAVVPALTIFTKKNPFSFEFFSLVMLMLMPKVFPSTPLFKSVVNTVYFLGFTDLARHMLSILTPQPTPSLPAVVALFCFAQMVEKCKIQYAGLTLVVALAAYVVYPATLIPLKPEYFFAIIAIGVAAIAFAVYEFA